jgi:vacuolar protein sorting-associated protein VTA1
MATNRLLGLPPITSELKSTAPYLQRADELKSQDPVMAYWCAYYAAQLGISLKAKDNPSRDVLFNLLGVLERMKKEIGSNDAIDMEAASSAYVENFALGVFAMADNEDRAGNGNRFVSTAVNCLHPLNASYRSTAKKFLAAANFLEVLKTFPKSEVAESVQAVSFTIQSLTLNHLVRMKKRFDTRDGKQQILPKLFVKAGSPLPAQQASHKSSQPPHHHHHPTTFDTLHLPALPLDHLRRRSALPHLLTSISHVRAHYPAEHGLSPKRPLAQQPIWVLMCRGTHILAAGEAKERRPPVAGVPLRHQVLANPSSIGSKYRRQEQQTEGRSRSAAISQEAAV